MPIAEIAIPAPICQDSGSSNMAQAQSKVIGGLRYSTLVTRVSVLWRRQSQYPIRKFTCESHYR
ncbi:hypothetical protein N018_03245 [Pseudomonas syringae CC1557]|uniref:Uncharacterized protein n=1 Tax=Pseudomonas syringae CC1557 TaxID=1357279 RepID=W0N2I9_PSESX|nr:hypothetical protein N018_03245 [Pseudomonas syringae CC1557]